MADAACTPTPVRPHPLLSSRCPPHWRARGRVLRGRDLELQRLHGMWKEASEGKRLSSSSEASPVSARPAWPRSSPSKPTPVVPPCSTGVATRTSRCRISPSSRRCASSPIEFPPGNCAPPSARTPRISCGWFPAWASGWDSQTPTSADPDTDRYRLLEAVSAWLAITTSERPLMLVLDDLHWASKGTLLLLRHLVRSAEPARMLIVAPIATRRCRPRYATCWGIWRRWRRIIGSR